MLPGSLSGKKNVCFHQVVPPPPVKILMVTAGAVAASAMVWSVLRTGQADSNDSNLFFCVQECPRRDSLIVRLSSQITSKLQRRFM